MPDYDFVTVEKNYRPIPFWSLNDRLEDDEMRRQVARMDEAGIGGYFMHARGGLETEYLSDDWFSAIGSAASEGGKRDMYAFAYDENGWPSGYAGGKVPACGREYTQKTLCFEKGEGHRDTTIANVGGYHFYYEENPFYADLLDAKVTDKFIEFSYEPYYRRFGSAIRGFFTDEPQLGRVGGLPWSLILPDEYKNAYGEDLIPRLPALVSGEDPALNIRYWHLIARLFKTNYAGRIGAWCREHGYLFTGHLLLEEDFPYQIKSSGAAMPSYEYFDIPGIDMLTRIKDPGAAILAPYQVASVAHQFGKKQIVTESFAACGHNASFDDLTAIFSWQAVRGVTLLCQHLFPYSMRGLRKRDYPPALFFQQPWWCRSNVFNDAVSRIGKLLSEGKSDFDTLVLHPIVSCWAVYKNDDFSKIHDIQNDFFSLLRSLEGKHVLFDLGDEMLLSEHGTVENGVLYLGKARYTRLILPDTAYHLPAVEALIDKFRAQGGVVLAASEVPENPVTDEPRFTYTRRLFDDFSCHYFVNSSNETVTASVAVGNKRLDPSTGTLADFSGTLTLPPFGSAMLIDTGKERRECAAPTGKLLSTDRVFHIDAFSPNALTLDTCAVRFDGELVSENDYALNVLSRALAFGKDVRATCDFRFTVSDIPEDLFLALETPEKFTATLNGTPVPLSPVGTFFDNAVKTVPIASYVREGENILTLSIDLVQSEATRTQIEYVNRFESELNKLRYDTEFESVYLVGSFGVKTDGTFTDFPAFRRYSGGFTVTKAPDAVTPRHLEAAGFPFFAGSITLSASFSKEDGTVFSFDKEGLNAVDVAVNDRPVGTLTLTGETLDLAPFMTDGENLLTLTVYTNLRNLLGPHHTAKGETNCTAPPDFYHLPNPFLPNGAPYEPGYAFVPVSLK